MRTIEQLFTDIRAMSPAEINENIAAHQVQIKALKKLLLLISEAEEWEKPDTSNLTPDTSDYK